MTFFSLADPSRIVSFKQATIEGQAPHRGLYFPSHIPRLSAEFIKDMKHRSPIDVAFDVIRPYVLEDIADDDLYSIVQETINFPIPLAQLSNSVYALELYHGNTLAFKDIGARFMSRCLGHFVQGNKEDITVLVATSGDTGGAVADGFYDVPGIKVVILYPAGKVSEVQERQLTTLGKNITALKVAGNFDDCQRMVKQAFSDPELQLGITLTSANSINVARWLPQQFFYFLAYQQWPHEAPPVFSVPSGNFGNICAGMLAAKSGLPVHHFIAACNANDTITRYLASADYLPSETIPTISNAMDVSDPSNFIRIIKLYNNDHSSLQKDLTSFNVTDEQTHQSMADVYANYKYLMDPHGAVGYVALNQYLKQHPEQKGIFLETAHPVKFMDVIDKTLLDEINIPAAVDQLMHKKKHFVEIRSYEELKANLI